MPRQTEKWLKDQPFGQVPVLEFDDGDTMHESRAIARYLAATNGGVAAGLIPDPADAKAVARFEQAAVRAIGPVRIE
jgi:glutathione S-transferase